MAASLVAIGLETVPPTWQKQRADSDRFDATSHSSMNSWFNTAGGLCTVHIVLKDQIARRKPASTGTFGFGLDYIRIHFITVLSLKI